MAGRIKVGQRRCMADHVVDKRRCMAGRVHMSDAGVWRVM